MGHRARRAAPARALRRSSRPTNVNVSANKPGCYPIADFVMAAHDGVEVAIPYAAAAEAAVVAPSSTAISP